MNTQPIARVGLTWLLLAQVLAIAPHLLHLPLWVIALWLLCAGWRVQAYRMRASLPKRAVRLLLLLAACAGVFLSAGSLFGLEGGVLLLVVTFTLKLIELRSRRDALLLIFLGFFVVVTGYLFNDGLLAALYSLLPVSCLVAALIGLQQSPLANRPQSTYKLAAVMLLQALPLMLMLFMFFPRLGPLWSLPSAQKALTGLAESMSPADIAELSRSPELAFRVSFNESPPAQSQLYWRALTLDHFDGRRWSQNSYNRFSNAPQWQKQGPSLSYNVIMQASGQPWLFSLDTAQTDLPGARQAGNFALEYRRPVMQSLMYQVQSWPQAQRQLLLPTVVERSALQLPASGDPQARQWGRSLAHQYGQDTQALVAALLQTFHREPYAYTLKPPLLGRDSIDEFLFETRSGFCAHYAGAMTFVLRAAGIPARVVAGYQGGEFNRTGNYLAVRQMDAHAWVEYWQAGRGWISVDPTFQVAPQRIELGSDEAFAEQEGFLEDAPLSVLRLRNIGWLNDLRFAWDNVNYSWQRWVLGYKSEQQMQLLQGWFGKFDWQRMAVLMLINAVVLVGLLAIWLMKPWQRERDTQLRALQRFERILQRQGLQRKTAEPVGQFCQRAAAALPQQAELIVSFARAFEAGRYAQAEHGAENLHASVRSLKRALWLRRR